MLAAQVAAEGPGIYATALEPGIWTEEEIRKSTHAGDAIACIVIDVDAGHAAGKIFSKVVVDSDGPKTPGAWTAVTDSNSGDVSSAAKDSAAMSTNLVQSTFRSE